MHHYVYKITNLITGEFYIGKHSTRFLWDHYMGSGTEIKDAIIFYGSKSFKKEIIKSFLIGIEAANYEHKLIADNINNLLCYNVSHAKYKCNWDSKHK